MTDLVEVSRHKWDELVGEFTSFFAGCGSVATSSDRVRFGADDLGTALELRADGTSSSFMPLHAMDARWEAVIFDAREDTVTLVGDGARYEYRVPPALRR